MSVNGAANIIDVAISGLRAQSARMDVISGNIANTNTSRTQSGQPYRSRHVLLAADADNPGCVRIDRILQDLSTNFKRIHMPGHPDADQDGYILMPNVNLPVEMMKLVQASRAYQANAAVLKRYQGLVDVAIELLR